MTFDSKTLESSVALKKKCPKKKGKTLSKGVNGGIFHGIADGVEKSPPRKGEKILLPPGKEVTQEKATEKPWH